MLKKAGRIGFFVAIGLVAFAVATGGVSPDKISEGVKLGVGLGGALVAVVAYFVKTE